MEGHDGRNEIPLRRRITLRTVAEIFFSLNLASAIAFAFLTYVINVLGQWRPSATTADPDLSYYLFRSVVRVEDLLLTGRINAVTTDALARQGSFNLPLMVSGLSILLTVSAAAVIIVFVLRIVSSTRVYQLLLGRLSVLIALCAAPGAVACVVSRHPEWIYQLHLLRTVALPADAVFVLLILLWCRRTGAYMWCSGVLIVLHYALTSLVLTRLLPVCLLFDPAWNNATLTLWILLAVFPITGVVSVLAQRTDNSRADVESREKLGAWGIVLTCFSVAALLLMWSPTWLRDPYPPKDLDHVTISLSRGPCYGMCPSYTLVLHGNGLVEYAGRKNVRVQGIQTSTISRERVQQILRSLDDAEFFTLEDRAFNWCFDTPSVGVSVIMDGKAKSVVADTCTASKTGPQARFVQEFDRIEQMIGSDQWTRCEGHCQ